MRSIALALVAVALTAAPAEAQYHCQDTDWNRFTLCVWDAITQNPEPLPYHCDVWRNVGRVDHIPEYVAICGHAPDPDFEPDSQCRLEVQDPDGERALRNFWDCVREKGSLATKPRKCKIYHGDHTILADCGRINPLEP